MPRFVIQFFVPLITHPSPSRRAVVIMPPGSEPASGSDSAKAGDHSPDAQRGRKRCLSSSEPKSRIGSVPSSCTMRISAVEAQAFATSSIAMLSINVPVPVPPYSTSKGRPRRSCSANSRRRSHGYSALASISAARGSTRSRTIWRIVSRKATWSSERAYVVSGGVLVAIRRSLEHLSAGVSACRGNGHPQGCTLERRPSCGHRNQHLLDRGRRDPVLRRQRRHLRPGDLDRRPDPDDRRDPGPADLALLHDHGHAPASTRRLSGGPPRRARARHLLGGG